MTSWTIILNILFLIIGFVILIKGADWFVDGASLIAEKCGVSQIVIGLTIVAMGTSLPEAAVSITAAFGDSSSIAIGNILGSNIANVLLILGLCALLQPLVIQKNSLWIEIPFVIVITTALMLMGMVGNKLGLLDALIMLALFALFFAYLIWTTLKYKKIKQDLPIQEQETLQIKQEDACVKQKGVWFYILMIILGGAMVIIGGQFVVTTASDLAKNWGMSQDFIGLTIVAIGTSLPELVTSVVAAKKGKADLAIGNILGSNIFNILFVLGTTSLIKPLIFDKTFIFDNIVALIAIIMLWVLIMLTKEKKLKRLGGIVMVSSYIGYLIYLIITRLSVA